jgi:hypothetical protein
VHVMTVDGRRRTGSSPTRFFLGPPPTKALTTSSSSPADWITGLSFGGFALTPTSQPDHSCPVGVMLRCIRIRTEARQPCPFLLRRYAWSISTPDSFSDCGSCWRRWITLQFQCIDCAAGGACWTTPKGLPGRILPIGANTLRSPLSHQPSVPPAHLAPARFTLSRLTQNHPAKLAKRELIPLSAQYLASRPTPMLPMLAPQRDPAMIGSRGSHMA